jgi:membrane-associated phospholipid phosphatase
MPKQSTNKVLWSVFILAIGIIIALSRVGVGAHYPGDVLIGCVIGFIVAIVGIVINSNLSWLDWIKNKRFYPIFTVVLIIWSCLIVTKIIGQNLPVFYLSLFSLVGTLYLITNAYIKKN